MGPMTFGKKEEQIFLGREMGKAQDYSEATAVAIDAEVKRFVTSAYELAKNLLTEHKASLLRIADELMVREVLDAEQVKRLAKGLPIDDPTPTPPTTPTADAGEEQRTQTIERPAIVPAMGKPVGQE